MEEAYKGFRIHTRYAPRFAEHDPPLDNYECKIIVHHKNTHRTIRSIQRSSEEDCLNAAHKWIDSQTATRDKRLRFAKRFLK